MPGLCTKDEHDRFGSLLEISKMSIWDKENVNRYSYVTELNIVLLSFLILEIELIARSKFVENAL